MTNVMLEVLHGFSLVCPDKPVFKVLVFTSELTFELKLTWLMNISITHCNSNITHSFDFYSLTTFAISIDLW